MGDMLVHESISIFVVRQDVISEFLTVNNLILELNAIQFIKKTCWVRSFYNTADRYKPELEERPIRKRSRERDCMVLYNLMIQWNPKLVPINIIELILLVNSRGLLISRFVSDLGKIFRLNTRPLTLTQEEVIIELE